MIVQNLNKKNLFKLIFFGIVEKIKVINTKVFDFFKLILKLLIIKKDRTI